MLRQALARLRDEGRIYARKGSGTYVTDAMPQARPVAVDTLKNIADIRDFLELRRFIEGEAAAQVARQRTHEQMHQIRRCRERFDQALAEGSDALEEDVAFHDAVAQACGNRFFSMTMTALAPQTRFSIGLARSLAGRPRRDSVCHGHAAVERAIECGNADAARQAMELHLRGGIDRLFGRAMEPEHRVAAGAGISRLHRPIAQDVDVTRC